MEIVGSRQRLDRIVTDTRKLKDRDPLFTRMAANISRHYAERFPDQPKLVEIMLINTRWRTDEPVMTHPVGRWQIPPADTLSKSHYSVLVHFMGKDGHWIKWREPSSEFKPAVGVPVTLSPGKNTVIRERRVIEPRTQPPALGKPVQLTPVEGAASTKAPSTRGQSRPAAPASPPKPPQAGKRLPGKSPDEAK